MEVSGNRIVTVLEKILLYCNAGQKILFLDPRPQSDNQLIKELVQTTETNTKMYAVMCVQE